MATKKSGTAAPRLTETSVTESAEVETIVNDESTADAFDDAVDEAAPAGALKKKELVERVALASGAKKKDVKIVVEATLRALGEALSNGEELVLPPFGRARVNRTRAVGEGEMMMIRLRRGGGKAGGAEEVNETLADAED